MENFHHSRSREIYPVSSLKEVQESPYYLVFSYSIKLHEKRVNIRKKQGNNTKIGQNENFFIKNPPTSCQVLEKSVERFRDQFVTSEHTSAQR